MSNRDIVVIGSSAGGVEALSTIVRELPADLKAAVFIVQHITPEATSILPEILRRAGRVPAHHAVDGEPIAYGRIYVAPPDNHLVLRDGVVRIVHGPRENRSRPAVDPLFRSAAVSYGTRVIGVVLSGALDDGTAGLYAIKARGGLAIVQDPADALIPSMPRSALEYVSVDHRVPADEIGPLLARVTSQPVAASAPPPTPRLEMESAMSTLEPATMEDDTKYAAAPSPFTCPECHGTLWEIVDGELVRYRCRVGHSYTSDSMTVEQEQATERALWAALRSLEEKAALSRRLAENARRRSHSIIADRFAERATATEDHAETVRRLLLSADEHETDLTSIDSEETPTSSNR
jgi:two-component system chemotaxis response regulator CheB